MSRKNSQISQLLKSHLQAKNDIFKNCIHFNSFFEELSGEEFRKNLQQKIRTSIPDAKHKYDDIQIQSSITDTTEDIYISIIKKGINKNKVGVPRKKINRVLHLTLHFKKESADNALIGAFHVQSDTDRQALRLILEFDEKNKPSLKFINELVWKLTNHDKDYKATTFNTLINEDQRVFAREIVNAVNEILPNHVKDICQVGVSPSTTRTTTRSSTSSGEVSASGAGAGTLYQLSANNEKELLNQRNKTTLLALTTDLIKQYKLYRQNSDLNLKKSDILNLFSDDTTKRDTAILEKCSIERLGLRDCNDLKITYQKLMDKINELRTEKKYTEKNFLNIVGEKINKSLPPDASTLPQRSNVTTSLPNTQNTQIYNNAHEINRGENGNNRNNENNGNNGNNENGFIIPGSGKPGKKGGNRNTKRNNRKNNRKTQRQKKH